MLVWSESQQKEGVGMAMPESNPLAPSLVIGDSNGELLPPWNLVLVVWYESRLKEGGNGNARK